MNHSSTEPCPKCGRNVAVGAADCAHCGQEFSSVNDWDDHRNRKTPVWVWVLIALFALPLLCCGGCFIYVFLLQPGSGPR